MIENLKIVACDSCNKKEKINASGLFIVPEGWFQVQITIDSTKFFVRQICNSCYLKIKINSIFDEELINKYFKMIDEKNG